MLKASVRQNKLILCLLFLVLKTLDSAAQNDFKNLSDSRINPDRLEIRNITNTSSASTCTLTGTISGNNCVGSILTLTTNNALKSIKWVLNDSITLSEKIAGFNPNGIVIAGGNGSGAGLNQFSNPNRFFIDAEGNFYVPDMSNNRVVKWAPGATSGIKVAGGNGSGNAANQFNRPTSVCLDSHGNMYVADQNNNRIQKWTPGASSGTTFASNIHAPTSLFVDKSDNIYVSEQGNNVIKKIPPTGGAGSIVAGGNGQLYAPSGIYVDDSDNIYICDTYHNRIVKWAAGASSGIVVAGGNGYGLNANQLASPIGIYVDNSGTMYISDWQNNRVQQWLPGASSGSTIAGNGLGASITPAGIFLDANRNLIVSDYGMARILRFNNNLNYTYTVLQPGKYTATIVSADDCLLTTNKIRIYETKIPELSISSDVSLICPAVVPTFTAMAVNGGLSPLFQWKINGVNVGSNGYVPTFSPDFLKNNDSVSCVMTSSEICTSAAFVTSNSITITKVDQVSTPGINITSNQINTCGDNHLIFTANPENEGPNPTFVWILNGSETGVNTKVYDSYFKDGDEVYCRMDVSLPCLEPVNSNVVKLNIHPVPSIEPQNNILIVWGDSIALHPVINGDIRYYKWSPEIGLSNPAIPNPMASPPSTTTYTLDVETNAGCHTSSSIEIEVIHSIVPPNTFTPNGDNINDTWEIKGIAAFPKCKVSVYNRYGNEVYRSAGYSSSWDGSHKGLSLSTGTYYYLIQLTEKEVLKGYVTIIK